VPFPETLADELAALMVGKDRDALVFTDQRGGVLRNSNWPRNHVQILIEQIGVDVECHAGPGMPKNPLYGLDIGAIPGDNCVKATDGVQGL